MIVDEMSEIVSSRRNIVVNTVLFLIVVRTTRSIRRELNITKV